VGYFQSSFLSRVEDGKISSATKGQVRAEHRAPDRGRGAVWKRGGIAESMRGDASSLAHVHGKEKLGSLENRERSGT